MKRKLLYLTMPPPFGGGEIRNYYLNNFFKSKESYFIFDGTNKLNSKSRQGRFILYNLVFGFFIVFKLFYSIYKIKPHVLYLSLPKNFHPFLRTSLIILFASVLNIKIVGDLAGMDFYFLNGNYIERKFGLYILKKVTTIRLLGESIKIKMEKLYNINNTVVFDNGIFLPQNKSIQSKDFSSHINFLYCGALNREKGIMLIIESIKKILVKKNSIRFTFLGEWSDKELKRQVEDFIVTNNIEEYVEFPGRLVDDRKWKYFLDSHIYLQFSYMDGQPLSVLEAMGFGLPVIASKVGAIPDTVINNRNGILIEDLNLNNICDTIIDILDNPVKCQNMSKNNLEDFKRRFTLDIYLNNVKELLENV